MDTLTEKVGDILEKLGQVFLVAGYLPAALFVVAHQLYLLPRWLGQPITLFQTDPAQTTSQWIYLVDQSVTLLLLPLLLGVLLMALNTIAIKLYEGAYAWQRRCLLRPWQQRNQRRAEALHGELLKLKKAYTGTLADLASLPEGADSVPLEQKRASLALEMQRAHEAIAEQSLVQRLPRRPGMVKPTALGNAFAVIEEYPYERYGMDGVLFWPRLRPLLDESYAATLVNAKMVLDLLLNLSLLALVFGLEAVMIGVLGKLDWTLIEGDIGAWILSYWSKLDWALIGVGIGAWILSYICYRGAVSTVYSLGDTIALCFDLYRGKLWKQFGFTPPKSLEEEQAVWLRLGQFLRRGESFYFPDMAMEREKQKEEKKNAKEDGKNV